MFPGMNPRQMQHAMKQLGIRQEDIAAIEVIIKLQDREIVISSPSVQKIKMQGQESFQISGNISERSLNSTPEITAEDIDTIMEQTGCSREDAMQAMEESDGDLAEAIVYLVQKED
ncbi:MAG: nascent polypeptide-associated complex protein [Candidatus Woesearchaeota archaeon]|jgi:nascent polypeptide-associated complex subunit alpha